jgi:putative heme degradation protein
VLYNKFITCAYVQVTKLLQRNPMQRLTAERLASSRMFSAVTATTTNVPLHAVQQAGKMMLMLLFSGCSGFMQVHCTRDQVQ